MKNTCLMWTEMSTDSTGDFQNPVAFRLHTCYYCRASKPDAVRDSDGNVIHRLMYYHLIPRQPTLSETILQETTKLREISICNNCMELMI